MKTPALATTRPWLLLIVGLGIIIFEAVLGLTDSGQPSYPIVVAALLMMGIKIPVDLDQKFRAKAEEIEDPPVPAKIEGK